MKMKCIALYAALIGLAGIAGIETNWLREPAPLTRCHHDGLLTGIDYSRTWRVKLSPILKEDHAEIIIGVCKDCGAITDITTEGQGYYSNFPVPQYKQKMLRDSAIATVLAGSGVFWSPRPETGVARVVAGCDLGTCLESRKPSASRSNGGFAVNRDATLIRRLLTWCRGWRGFLQKPSPWPRSVGLLNSILGGTVSLVSRVAHYHSRYLLPIMIFTVPSGMFGSICPLKIEDVCLTPRPLRHTVKAILSARVESSSGPSANVRLTNVSPPIPNPARTCNGASGSVPRKFTSSSFSGLGPETVQPSSCNAALAEFANQKASTSSKGYINSTRILGLSRMASRKDLWSNFSHRGVVSRATSSRASAASFSSFAASEVKAAFIASPMAMALWLPQNSTESPTTRTTQQIADAISYLRSNFLKCSFLNNLAYISHPSPTTPSNTATNPISETSSQNLSDESKVIQNYHRRRYWREILTFAVLLAYAILKGIGIALKFRKAP